jgi:hypothetical protein
MARTPDEMGKPRGAPDFDRETLVNEPDIDGTPSD